MMTISDWVLLALIAAAAAAAVWYAKRHPGCSGSCESCHAGCSCRKQACRK